MTSRCPSNLRRLLGRMFAILLFTVALPAVAAAQTGTVTGTVTNSATNAPLAGRFLIFCTTAGCFATSNTNASGVYSVNLAPGNYVAYTSNFNTLGVANDGIMMQPHILREVSNGDASHTTNVQPIGQLKGRLHRRDLVADKLAGDPKGAVREAARICSGKFCRVASMLWGDSVMGSNVSDS